MIARGVLLVAPLLLVGCGTAPVTAVPQPPSVLEQPAEYAWGDAVAGRDDRMAQHVTGALAARFGQAREDRFVAKDVASIAELQRWYAERLGTAWQPLSLDSALEPGEHGFGFSHDNEALAVTWLDAQSDGRVPVTILTFGAPTRR